jgi:hypothetical protein
MLFTALNDSKRRGIRVKKKKIKVESKAEDLEEIVISKREFDLILKLASRVEEEEYVIEIAGTDAVLDDSAIRERCEDNKTKDASALKNDEAQADQETQGEDDDIFVFTPEITGLSNIQNYSLDNTEHIQRKWKSEDKIGLLLINNIFDYHNIAFLLSTWKDFLSDDAKVAIFGSDKPGPAKAVKEAVSDGGNFKLHKKLEKLAVIVSDDCVHHWMIDSSEMGVCKFCGRKRNFRKLMRISSRRGGRRK